MKRGDSDQVAQYIGPEAGMKVAKRRRGGIVLARRQAVSVSILAGLVVLAGAANAWALSGTPINIGPAGQATNAPAVAVSANGTAYIAWPNSNDSSLGNETIQYCVLPAGASQCEYTNTLTPVALTGFSSSVYGPNVQVLLDGTTVVLLADTGDQNGDYGPVQEWTSTDGGASFDIVNEGRSVAYDPYGHKSPLEGGITDLDSAVMLPGGGTNSLGIGWTDASGIIGEHPGLPEFSEFPFASPPECSTESCSTPNQAQSLQPAATYPPAGNSLPAVFASQSNEAGNIGPGVLGLFSTSPSNENATCPGSGPAAFGTAYVYGSGAQSSSNSYGITPGQPNSAWKVAYSPADCGVELPAVAGGPSGFGVVEDDALTDSVIYHPFDQQSMNFSAPEATIAPGDAELFASVSQDGAGGIYATYQGLSSTANPEGIRLAYSANGGQTWTGPATLNADSEESGLVSAVGSDGQGWASWQQQDGNIYAQQFDSSDATPSSTTPPTTKSTTPTSSTSSPPPSIPPAPNGTVAFTATVNVNGTSVTLTFAVTCKSTAPCVITIEVTASGVSGSISFAASAKHKATKRHPKIVVVASGTLTLAAGATRKVALHLTKAGKKLLAADHGHLKTKVEVKDTSAGHTTKSSHSLTISTAKTSKKKGKH